MTSMHKHPLLTISLMTSNRKDTIGRCLDSLATLRSRVPSELIIVDTGCDAEMRQIIESYTDHIVTFSWCDDFAAARNSGLREAKGEWYLFLDDDEWFVDTEAIEEFFLSGTYQNFDEASYVVRNYGKKDGSVYEDGNVKRMVHRTPETRFEGRIHEILITTGNRQVLLPSMVEHYGYAFDTEEERVRHALRNIEPLKEMLKEKPEEYHYAAQLVVEYLSISECSELEQLCQEKLQQLQGASDLASNAYRGTFYAGEIAAEMGRFHYEEAEQLCERALADQGNLSYAQADITHRWMECAFDQQKYDLALQMAQKYQAFYLAEQEKGPDPFQQGILLVRTAFDEQHAYDCCYMGWVSAVHCKKAKEAEAFFQAFLEFDATKIRKALHETIQSMEPSELLVHLISQVDAENEVVLYYRILDAHYQEKDRELMELFQRFFECVTDIFSYKEAFWNIGIAANVPLEQMFLQLPFWKYERYGSIFHAYHVHPDFEQKVAAIREWKTVEDPRYELLDLREAELAIQWSATTKKEEAKQAFASRARTFFQGIYGEELLELDKEDLPEILRHANRIWKGKEA